MSDIEIRIVKGEECDFVDELLFYSFSESPGKRKKRDFSNKDFQDYKEYVLFQNGKPKATITGIPMTQNVRGQIVKMIGITSVASYPEARHHGYIRKLLQQVFNDAKKEGFIASTLYPFKEAFYGKLGYATFTQAQVARFKPRSLSYLTKVDLPGEVERVELKYKTDEYVEYLTKMQSRYHGMCIRTHLGLYKLKLADYYWLAIAREKSTGEIIGELPYRIMGFEKNLEAANFYYSSSLGKYLILQWLAYHIDQVSEVILPIKPVETLETWVTDLHAHIESREWIPSGMGRVLDVAGLKGLPVGKGRFTATITDQLCPWNNKTYNFESIDGKLHIEETSKAECELTIQALSAIIYGGHDPEDFQFRGWGKVPIDVQREQRSMFPRVLVHMHESF